MNMDWNEFYQTLGAAEDFVKSFEPYKDELLSNATDEFPFFMERDFYTQYYPLCGRNDCEKVFAEMENTKKRLKEDAIKERKYASQKVVSELVDPIDMLVKVINFGSPNPEIQNYLYGFKMIADKLVDILKTEGLGEVVALNQKFDPKTMEAMSVVENDELEEDTVVEVKQTGYTYKDRLIRPAMVVVSKKTKKNEEIIEERKEEE